MHARVTTTSASVGSLICASGTFSTRTSWTPYITVARMRDSCSVRGLKSLASRSCRPTLDLDARQERAELREIHGLRQVMIEPGFAREPLVIGLTPAGERDEHDAAARLVRADGARDVVAGHVGHPDVEQHDAGHPFGG